MRSQRAKTISRRIHSPRPRPRILLIEVRIEFMQALTEHLPGRLWVHTVSFSVALSMGIEDYDIIVVLQNLDAARSARGSLHAVRPIRFSHRSPLSMS